MVLLAGCTNADSTSIDRFSADGRVIALSGAEAGAANACITCHGLDGKGNGAGAPRLAGLDAGYMERQLEAYADGRRYHKQMNWISQQLSAQDRQTVSAYYAGMPAGAAAATTAATRSSLFHQGDATRGLLACAACHGELGKGLGPANPPLAGQPSAYLAEQLRLWRIGKRRNDPGDVMLRISQLLTPSEAKALADYSATLPGGPPSPGSPATSPAARRGDPRSGASGPPLHVPESARVRQ